LVCVECRRPHAASLDWLACSPPVSCMLLLTRIHARCPRQPGSAKTESKSVFREPGSGAFAASLRPGPWTTPGNQTALNCIPWARDARSRATKQAPRCSGCSNCFVAVMFLVSKKSNSLRDRITNYSNANSGKQQYW
jgi:hypothetical protein